ncbi:MAG TPA: glycosyltransferase family 4 protein [Solirubrobacteraceae bacterium]|nr:glycosyltransferase family 4 protein [Solirubrobacteraceae bacterium]
MQADEEPTQASIRARLRPAELLAELGCDGDEAELSRPLTLDATQMVVEAESDASGGERYIGLPSATGVDAPSVAAAPLGPVEADARTPPLGVAYLLPGLPPEGSGGSHSLVQEARGLRGLGAHARICVPVESLDAAATLYGNDDALFVAYADESRLPDAVGDARVVVATEHPSVALAERLTHTRPGLVCAYYIQDYEPLFAPPHAVRSDRALLSYRAIPGQLLFAKTHWLRNVVSALHGVPVAKVAPSLDRELFHERGRQESERELRVGAMIRPRTPRRRPLATLAALRLISAQLGERARIVTFGCDQESFDLLEGREIPNVRHLGLLSRREVSELMRACDVFIDASAYQAFGRTGLEGMACGAVPVLPAFGGVHEYAVHDGNAIVLDDGDPTVIAAAVLALGGDRERLRRLRQAGLLTVRDFSIERAARSQLELFSAVADAAAPRRLAPVAAG